MGWQSQIVKRCRWGEPPYWCLVKMFQHQRHGVFFAAVLLPPLGATLHAMLVRAERCGLLYVVQTAFGFGRVVDSVAA
jgi:hypothetical protein